MELKLLINLTNNISNMTAYFYNEQYSRFEILDIINFSTKNIITNSTISDSNKLKELIESNYQKICENTCFIKFSQINLVVPFQIPILIEKIYVNNQFVKYKKKFDETQFFLIKEYRFNLNKTKKHYAYFINNSLFKKYLNIFSELHLKIYRITTPALLVSQIFSPYSKYNSIIELEDKKITYNFYYGQNLIESKSISHGIDYIYDYLNKKLKENYFLNENFNIRTIIPLLKVPILLNNKNTSPLMIFFSDKPIAIMEFFVANFKDAIERLIISLISKTLKKFQIELHVGDLENVCLYKNEFVYTLFAKQFENSNICWTKIQDWKWNNQDIDDPIIKTFFKLQTQKINKINQLKKAKQNSQLITLTDEINSQTTKNQNFTHLIKNNKTTVGK